MLQKKKDNHSSVPFSAGANIKHVKLLHRSHHFLSEIRQDSQIVGVTTVSKLTFLSCLSWSKAASTCILLSSQTILFNPCPLVCISVSHNAKRESWLIRSEKCYLLPNKLIQLFMTIPYTLHLTRLFTLLPRVRHYTKRDRYICTPIITTPRSHYLIASIHRAKIQNIPVLGLLDCQ